MLEIIIDFYKSTSIIDLIYLIILWYFKEYNSIPMSTTWVFIGLLSGRELAIGAMEKSMPIIAKDFGKLMVGVAASMGIIIGIHTLGG